MTSKELIKLAAACRKAGIKHYKTNEFEFTLTDDLAPKAPKLTAKAPIVNDNSEFTTDHLDSEQLLYWSTGQMVES